MPDNIFEIIIKRKLGLHVNDLLSSTANILESSKSTSAQHAFGIMVYWLRGLTYHCLFEVHSDVDTNFIGAKHSLNELLKLFLQNANNNLILESLAINEWFKP